MCTIALAFHAHPRYPLVLASNRDEFYARPSRAAQFWDEQPDLLAGRDLRGGGTWLGVTRSGRFSALTNIRQGFQEKVEAPSRGELVMGYLKSDRSPSEHAEHLISRAREYNGFNLLLGDPGELVLLSNRADEPIRLEPGVYGLSNAVPGRVWPKAERARTLLETLLAEDRVSPESLMELLADADRPNDEMLPNTGVGLEWERVLSPIFISTPDYGTCASTALIVDAEGHARFVERRPRVEGDGPPHSVEENQYSFHIPAFATSTV